MSIACQKRYNLTVVTPTLYYWTLDEPGQNDNRVDSAQGVILPVVVGVGFAAPNVGPGLFGNALILNHPIPQGSQVATGGFAGGTDSKINYTQGQGLTAWGWVKMNAVYGNGPLVFPFDMSFFSDAAGNNLMAEIDIILNSNIAGTIIGTAVVTDDAIHDIVTTTQVLPVGTWAFYAVRWDPSTGLTSVRFNNNAWTTGAVVLNLKTGGFGSMAIGPAGGGANFDCTIDEVGIAKKVLTDNQVNSLFNGGAGVTWPTISTIV